jgi:pimeloyl-ACP methyl ester carboxylesterase
VRFPRSGPTGHGLVADPDDACLSQKFVEGGYTLTDMACNTAVLLTALGIERAQVVGQSMGGMIASTLREAP